MTQMNQYSLESVMATAWEQEDTVISLVEEGNLFKFLLRSTLVLSANVLNYNTNQFQQKQWFFPQMRAIYLTPSVSDTCWSQGPSSSFTFE